MTRSFTPLRNSIYFATLWWGVSSSLILADPSARQIIEGTDRFEMTYRTQIPKLERSARLWLPLARSSEFQEVKIKTLRTPTAWELIEDCEHGNRVLFMELDPRHSQAWIEIQYSVLRSEKSAYDHGSEDVSMYLHPDRLVPRHRMFEDLAHQASQGQTSDLAKGRALYDHTLERMRYEKSGEGWGEGNAIYACDARTGNCTDFHAYFIALCRSLDIPARFAIGFTIPADSHEGVIGGYHCWAEFYAAGRWIPVDISEADKHPELADYYFGHHPANRFELSSGRDLEVDPAPATGPFNFLVYPLLESDGAVRPTQNQFSFKREVSSLAR